MDSFFSFSDKQQSTHILTHDGSGVLAEQWVLMMCQSVAVSVSTINTLTASCSSVGNPIQETLILVGPSETQ